MRSRSLSICPLSALYITCSKSLINSLHFSSTSSPTCPAADPQLGVHQVHSHPHARVRPRHAILRRQVRMRLEILPDHVVVRCPRRLLLVSRCVPVHRHPAPMLCVPRQKLRAGFKRGSVPDHDLVQHAHVAVSHLRHHRTHRVHVEIQRPKQRQIRIRLQLLHVRAPVERRVYPRALQAQVLAQNLLLVEAFVVALLATARSSPECGPAGTGSRAASPPPPRTRVRDPPGTSGRPSRNPSASTPRIRTGAPPCGSRSRPSSRSHAPSCV